MDFREVEELIVDYLVENGDLDVYKLLFNKFLKFLETLDNESRLFYIDK